MLGDRLLQCVGANSVSLSSSLPLMKRKALRVYRFIEGSDLLFGANVE